MQTKPLTQAQIEGIKKFEDERKERIKKLIEKPIKKKKK
jgi:hypothetical protein